MKVEERIDEAIYQLEKIKGEIVDYDTCREEVINCYSALEQIRKLLNNQREYMYAGKPIVDQVVEKIEDIITRAIGEANPSELSIAEKKIYADIIQYLMNKDYTESLSDGERYGALIRYVHSQLNTDWYGILGDAVLKHFTHEVHDNEVKLELLIAYPHQYCKLNIIPISLWFKTPKGLKEEYDRYLH